MDEITERLLELYNANLALMDGTTDPVKRIVAEAEIVFAVWPDPADPSGFDRIVIKGNRLLREVIASGQSAKYRFSVVPCQEYEQAVAAKAVLVGEREFDA